MGTAEHRGVLRRHPGDPGPPRKRALLRGMLVEPDGQGADRLRSLSGLFFVMGDRVLG